MSWAEVKRINSDMSLPLDELFRNSIILIPSTDVFYSMEKKEGTKQNKITDTSFHELSKTKFNCNISGTAKLQSILALSTSLSYRIPVILKASLFKNGELYREEVFEVVSISEGSSDAIFNFNADIHTENVSQFELVFSYSVGSYTDISPAIFYSYETDILATTILALPNAIKEEE